MASAIAFAIEAVLIFTAVFCIWAGAKKGFVRSVMGVATVVVSVVAAYAFTPLLAPVVSERFLDQKITGEIEETLCSQSDPEKTGVYDLDKLASELPESFTSILNRYDKDSSGIVERMRGETAASRATVRAIAEDIASGTVRVLSSVIAFLVLFIASFILLSILTAVLDLLFSMPVLKQANVVLGIVFGIVEAAVFLWVLSIALSVLVRALGAIDPNGFGDEVVNHTVICRFFLRYNPFDLLYGVLK